jgi:hypothetical protein
MLMRMSRKPLRICDVPLVSSRVSPIRPALCCKSATLDSSASFKRSLARLRILEKVLNGRQPVGFGQKAEARQTWRANQAGLAPNNVTLLQRATRSRGDKASKAADETSHCNCEGPRFPGNDP